MNPRGPSTSVPSDTAHVVIGWSANYAAIVGVVICILLLVAWFEAEGQRRREAEDES